MLTGELALGGSNFGCIWYSLLHGVDSKTLTTRVDDAGGRGDDGDDGDHGDDGHQTDDTGD